MRSVTIALAGAVAACGVIAGLDRDFEKVDCLRDCPALGEGGDDATPREPFADADAGATRPPGVVETVANAISDAIDFDLRPDDVLYLRANPSRIDACKGLVCVPLVDTTRMPAEHERDESAPDIPTRSNASIAYLPEIQHPGSSYVLVAQRGVDTCSGGTAECGVDSPRGLVVPPGLYSVPTGGSGAIGGLSTRRWTATVALTTGKSGRATDGFLVGRAETWAVAQVVSNESPPAEFTSVFTTNSASGLDVHRLTLDRGYFPSGSIQPFVFAATTTPRGAGGYAGADRDFVDIADGGSRAGFIPTHAAVTTNDPGAASVFARGLDTPPDMILAFRNASPVVVDTFPYPGLNKDASILVATDRHVAFFGPVDGDGGRAITIHACLAADILARRCIPAIADLPIETIIRVRSRGPSLYVLGKALGTPRLLRVTFP